MSAGKGQIEQRFFALIRVLSDHAADRAAVAAQAVEITVAAVVGVHGFRRPFRGVISIYAERVIEKQPPVPINQAGKSVVPVPARFVPHRPVILHRKGDGRGAGARIQTDQADRLRSLIPVFPQQPAGVRGCERDGGILSDPKRVRIEGGFAAGEVGAPSAVPVRLVGDRGVAQQEIRMPDRSRNAEHLISVFPRFR